MSSSRPARSPAQMPIEISMTLPAAKPATASARSRARPVRSCAAASMRGVERHQAVAQALDPVDQVFGVVRRAAPDQAQPARRHVDAADLHGRLAGEDRFDQPDAGAALQAVDRQGQFVRAVGTGGDVAGEVGAFGRLGARGAQRGVEQALAVVLAEAEALDDLIGRRTAGAAEAAAGGGGQAAMGADGNLSRAARGRGRGAERRG